MTENRTRSNPPPRTAPMVTPSNGNTTPPASLATSPYTPNPDVMTKESLRDAVTEIVLLLKYPEKIEENQYDALKNFRQLTRAAVGDKVYHPLFKSAVVGILEKGGTAGAEMIEKIERRLDQNATATTDMVTSVKNARMFGKDDTLFRENYNTVSDIVNNAMDKYGQTLHLNHTDTKKDFVAGLTDMLDGKSTPVIIRLTQDERKKHIPVIELV